MYQNTLSIQDKIKLDNLLSQIQTSSHHMLGYPIDCKSIDSNYLLPFMKYMINNLSDPFSGGNYQLNTFEFELDLVRFFGNLLGCNDCWGYVTSGGSEGNLQGLITGREVYNDTPIYFSDQSHYSVFKAANVLRGDIRVIKSNIDGSINLPDFESKLTGDKAIVSLNIGTTMLAGVDNWVEAIRIMRKKKMKYYVHFDAALLGLIYPFIFPERLKFRHFNSIAISGHKMLGCPVPCGMFLADKAVDGQRIEYINGTNKTLLGSRSGLAVLTMWHAIKKFGRDGLKERAKKCMILTKYLYEQLKNIEYEGLVWTDTNTIVFKKPNDSICKKWQLATQGNLAHVVVMPSTNKQMLNKFIGDMLFA